MTAMNHAALLIGNNSDVTIAITRTEIEPFLTQININKSFFFLRNTVRSLSRSFLFCDIYERFVYIVVTEGVLWLLQAMK